MTNKNINISTSLASTLLPRPPQPHENEWPVFRQTYACVSRVLGSWHLSPWPANPHPQTQSIPMLSIIFFTPYEPTKRPRVPLHIFSFPIRRCRRVNTQCGSRTTYVTIFCIFFPFPYLYQEVKNQALIGFSVVVSSLGIGEFLTMPRPGPRPYECVRRAWHSDRHQPIRGSLIQEIFRYSFWVHAPCWDFFLSFLSL